MLFVLAVVSAFGVLFFHEVFSAVVGCLFMQFSLRSVVKVVSALCVLFDLAVFSAS